MVVTFTCALLSFGLMLLTGHDQGVHDNWFGFSLFVLLFLGTPTAFFLFMAYLVYAAVLRIRNR